MLIHKVRVDGQEFFLSDHQDPGDLQQLIVAAVRQGGDFVTFHTIGRGPIAVLCTPGIPVRFESIERSEEEVQEWKGDPPALDVDMIPFA